MRHTSISTMKVPRIRIKLEHISLLLFIALSAQTLPAKGDHHYQIKPIGDDGSSSKTLQEHLRLNASFFSVSNSLFEFLPGMHHLGGLGLHSLLIDGTHNTSWCGHRNTATAIICNESISIIFSHVRNLQIRDLSFFNCGHYLPSELFRDSFAKKRDRDLYNITFAALTLADVDSLQFESVAIKNSLGYGLLGINLHGISDLRLCSFLENNKECDLIMQKNVQDKMAGIDYCVGGNMMLLFADQPQTEHSISNTYINIRDSVFRGGMDYSQNAFQCNPDTSQTVRHGANGFGIVLRQQWYKVHLTLEGVNFMEDINTDHSSVLIHDSSGVTNNISVVNCLFNTFGVFRIVVTNESDCKDKQNNLCYKNDHTRSISQKIVMIKKCQFEKGVGTGLEICANPSHLRFGRFQIIAVQDSVFHHYNCNCSLTKHKTSKSVIRVLYTFTDKYTYRCPNVRVVIDNCQFSSNSIPSLIVHLGKDEYSKDIMKTPPCPVFVTKHTTFSSNWTPNNSTLVIVTQVSDRDFIKSWQFEDAKNKKSVLIDRVHIINTTFTSNTADMTRGILCIDKTYILLEECTLTSSVGTGLQAVDSVIRMEGLNRFINNTGILGGGLNLDKSRLLLMPNSRTLFSGNMADYGGGIFSIRIPKPKPLPKCFKNNQVLTYSLCSLSLPSNYYDRPPLNQSALNISIILKSNRAYYAGDSVFGGVYDKCRLVTYRKRGRCCTKQNFNSPFPQFIKVVDNRSSSEISSAPTRLCSCTNTSQCARLTLNAIPGQTVKLSLVALGDLNGTTNAVVSGTICKNYATFSNHICKHDLKNDIGYGQRMQLLSRNCTNISYTVNSFKVEEVIEVKISKEGTTLPSRSFPSVRRLIVHVNLLPCPPGFEIINKTGVAPGCKCINYLHEHNITCSIENGKVLRPDKTWIGYDAGQTKRIIVHKYCPFDYCLQGDKYIDLGSPEEQCNYNRSGLLCGKCSPNTSLVLGGSTCTVCSDEYLLLILPFTLAGILLVFLLLKCNLTVSTGDFNVIVFYANIVQINKHNLFLGKDFANSILSVFIAWLNLDFGIQTCFFGAMDMYTKTWLQFVFPVYVWILIGLIVVLANYSSRANRLIGNNSVPVLATLLFLSYTKLLRTIIASVSFTYIEYENEPYVTVWLFDPNIEYFSLKHTLLFLTALVFSCVYVVPLTLIVLFAPCMQRNSHRRGLRWINKLKPFIDAFQGPYSDRYRYWTGQMLLVRLGLSILFAVNYQSDSSVNYFFIIVVTVPIGVLVLSRSNAPVYKHKVPRWIGSIVLLNLVGLMAIEWVLTTTLYPKWKCTRKYVAYISVAGTLFCFVAVLVYRTLFLRFCQKMLVRKQTTTDARNTELPESQWRSQSPTHSVVELIETVTLKEPLLETSH